MNYMNVPSKFNWTNLGDIELGRGNLGTDTTVLVYRLMQYSMKDILSREYGEESACELLRAAGYLAGGQFAENVLDLTGDFDFFVANLTNALKEYKIGILRIERSDLDNLKFTLTVSEDLDCSGLPVTDETVCDFDEGFISAIFEKYVGKPFDAKEVDCWASGDRTCRFNVKPV